MLATIQLRIFCFHTPMSEHTKLWFCLLFCVGLILVFSHWVQNIEGVWEQGAQENSWAQVTGGSRRLENVLWRGASSFVHFIKYYHHHRRHYHHIIRATNSRWAKWARHVASMAEAGNVYRFLVGKHKGKIPFERPRCSWGDVLVVGPCDHCNGPVGIFWIA
jgi:hypothetical protein